MHTFVSVAVIDPGGRILMQERDEHPLHDPEKWCLPGGGTEPGEDSRTAAARELKEETGLVVEPDLLESLGVTRFHSDSCGGDDEFELFVVGLAVSDDDVVCGEGRQMVFVAPDQVLDLDLAKGAALALRMVEAAGPVDVQTQPDFAGVILVDPRGWILLQERDEHAPIDPDRWGLPGGHVEPDETFEAAAHRELEEETGVRLEPGELELFGEFRVDHRQAHGTRDRMQVFVAQTALTDADIECHEGRQIVFVEPDRARDLDLTAAAALILPLFWSEPTDHEFEGTST